MNRTWVMWGSALGFLAVALGAFGAHMLKERLGTNHTIWETAVQYQMAHSLALMFLGLAAPSFPPKSIEWIGTLFSVGVAIFSGSLYVMALTDIKWLGAITPLGGLCFLAGWLTLLVATAKSPNPSAN